MNAKGHFTILVYPFRHAISGPQRDARLRALGGRWRPWWNRFDTGGLKQALDDTYFFLPYVRQLLYPETTHLTGNDPVRQMAELEEFSKLPSADLAKKMDTHGVLRLTYSPSDLENIMPLQLEVNRDQFKAPVRIGWIDIALFPQDVGFLILKVSLDEESCNIEKLNDLLYYLRQIHAPTLNWELPTWNRTKKDKPLVFKSRDLEDFLLQGLTEIPTPLDSSFDEFMARVQSHPTAPRYSTTQTGQVYGQAFREYTFTRLDLEAAGTETETTRVGSDGGLFGSTAERHLYELATCTQTSRPDYEPHPSQVKRLMGKGRVALWTNWEGLALHDNAIFLGLRGGRMTEQVLPHNVESDYFLLYLVAYYTKIRLSLFSGELMRRGAELHQNLKDARSIWDEFTMFRNHYWFSEITFKSQGTEIYRKFQDGLDVLSLYDSVSREVRELQEYYEHKASLERDEAINRLQTAMNENLTVVAEVQKNVHFIELFIVAVYSAHLYHMAVPGTDTHKGSWWTHVHWGVILCAILGLVIVMVIQKVLESRHKRKHKSHPGPSHHPR